MLQSSARPGQLRDYLANGLKDAGNVSTGAPTTAAQPPPLATAILDSGATPGLVMARERRCRGRNCGLPNTLAPAMMQRATTIPEIASGIPRPPQART